MGALASPSVVEEESAIMRALTGLAEQDGADVAEVGQVACDLLAAMLGADAAAYRSDGVDHAVRVAASDGAGLPPAVRHSPTDMVGASLASSAMVSSRMSRPERDLVVGEASPFAFAVSMPSRGTEKMVLVLTGDATAAVSIAASSLPLLVVELLDRMLQQAAVEPGR